PTGSSGLHVLIPLGRQCDYEQCRTIAQLISKVVVAEHPKISTLTRSPAKREGKAYLDWVQNGQGKLLVAPFSTRPLPGAPVSMPLEWREVGPKLDQSKFTIKNAVARMKKLKKDPLLALLDSQPNLHGSLERLSRRFGRATS